MPVESRELVSVERTNIHNSSHHELLVDMWELRSEDGGHLVQSGVPLEKDFLAVGQ